MLNRLLNLQLYDKLYAGDDTYSYEMTPYRILLSKMVTIELYDKKGTGRYHTIKKKIELYDEKGTVKC